MTAVEHERVHPVNQRVIFSHQLLECLITTKSETSEGRMLKLGGLSSYGCGGIMEISLKGLANPKNSSARIMRANHDDSRLFVYKITHPYPQGYLPVLFSIIRIYNTAKSGWEVASGNPSPRFLLRQNRWSSQTFMPYQPYYR